MSRQPHRDRYAVQARASNRIALDERNDSRELFWKVLRAVTLPLRLPLYIVDRFKQRRLMIALFDEMTRNRIISERLVEEVAAAWVELRPNQYPLGKDDPKFDRVSKQFRKIMERRRR